MNAISKALDANGQPDVVSGTGRATAPADVAASHSPLPWRVSELTAGVILDVNDMVVAADRHGYGPDAEFIVLSANSHYDLLDALKGMVAIYDGVRDALWSKSVIAKLAASDAAIAKAEGR